MRIEAASRDYRDNGLFDAAMLARRWQLKNEARVSLATVRLLHVAVETGARFVRERIEVDPLNWLLTGRELFNRRSAIEACDRPEGFRRAVVLHGLSLGLDAKPADVAGIPARDFLSDAATHYLRSQEPPRERETDRWEVGPSALYSCSISAELHDGHIQIFGALIARSPDQVRERLRGRLGPLLEEQAVVRLGFDWSEPLACALVSEAMAHVLSLAAESPTSSVAAGLDFYVEQRFAS